MERKAKHSQMFKAGVKNAWRSIVKPRLTAVDIRCADHFPQRGCYVRTVTVTVELEKILVVILKGLGAKMN
jgi:hypothetical protein